MIRYAGLILCLIVLIGAMNIIGADIFIDALSFLLVAIGAIGYALLRQDGTSIIARFGDGAVYFGWLGTIIGLIAIAANKQGYFTDPEKLGPALAVALLSIFYGYSLRLLSYALDKR